MDIRRRRNNIGQPETTKGSSEATKGQETACCVSVLWWRRQRCACDWTFDPSSWPRNRRWSHHAERLPHAGSALHPKDRQKWLVRGEVTSAGSYCYSACPLAFAGGTVRAGAGISLIGLHQVTNGRKSADYGTPGKRNLDAISTRSDVALKRKLSVYFTEMGIKPDEMFAMMGLAAPDGMHFLSNIEAMKSGLITKESNYSNEPGFVFYATDAQPTDAVAN